MALPGTKTGLVQPGMTGGATGYAPAQQYVPPTGLIGSEQALQGGLQGALSGLQQGFGQGRNDVLAMLMQGMGGAQGMLQQGQNGALGQIGQGVQGLQGYAGTGQQSMDLQAALSGAMGPQAQQQAFQQYTDSPGQAFLREQGEQAVTRNASATGGLGGGRVMQELQRQGIGLAAQDFDNQFNRLGSLSTMGLNAAGQIGQLRGQGAGILGQLAGQGANIAGQMGMQGASLLGGLGQQGGMSAADLIRGTSRDVASGRTNAGNAIAESVGAGSTALSNLINQQGAGLSDLMGQGGNSLANLLAGAGNQSGADVQQLMAMLAQISGNQGNQVAGLPGLPGTGQQPGVLEGLGKLFGGVGGFMTGMNSSDARLKTNVRRIGVTPGGAAMYTWDWTPQGAVISGNGPQVGVMAHEVPYAASIGPEGYLMVDYSRVA